MTDPTNPESGSATVDPKTMPLLYKDPRPMDLAILGNYGLKSGITYSFAGTTNMVPISVAEFQFAQTSYPIVFAGDPPMPACVLGLQQEENLFVAENGEWTKDVYIPTYIRRYPVVLAEVPGDERKFLCADVEAEMVTDKNPEFPFFTDGKVTKIVNEALDFCRRFQEEIMMTQAFCDDLKKHNLLRQVELRFTAPDGTQQPAGVFTSIDNDAFMALPDSAFLELRARGTLPCIYFQQISQTNWGRLHMLREKRLSARAPANLN